MTKLEKELLTKIVYQWECVEDVLFRYTRAVDICDDYDAEEQLSEEEEKMDVLIQSLRNSLDNKQEADNAESEND